MEVEIESQIQGNTAVVVKCILVGVFPMLLLDGNDGTYSSVESQKTVLRL